MKLVNIETLKKAAPADLLLVLTTGRPFLQQDGSRRVTDAPMSLPCIPGAFVIDHNELLSLASEPLAYPDYPGRFQSSDMTLFQFRDVIRVLGFLPDAMTLTALRTVVLFTPVIQYALEHWVDTLAKVRTHPGSMPCVVNNHTIDMEELGFLTIGWSGSKAHMLLTPKGYRLALAISNLSQELLTGAMPEQYVSADFKTIAYARLWGERQGTVKQVTAAVHNRLDNYIGDL